VEGAAEVGAEQVAPPVWRGGAERKAFESALLQAPQQQRHIHLRMNGVARQRMVELESQVLARGDGHACCTQRDAGGRSERRGGPV